MNTTLYLVRGLPGSGKSTLAKQIIAKGLAELHFETDMYFVGKDGVYSFNRDRLKDAHVWCQQQADAALADSRSVVVSNTFVKKWETEAYTAMAERHGAAVCVLVASGQYQNIHGVPQETIDRMRSSWESW